MRSNGEQLNKAPRILLSTIHGVKGGECSNVVLLTDLSRNTQKNMNRFPDDENRLFENCLKSRKSFRFKSKAPTGEPFHQECHHCEIERINP